ncbi:MAG: tetratricopeptide repeat protein [Desulfatiglandales bacterium]
MDIKRIAAKGCFLLAIILGIAPLAGAESLVLKELHLKNGTVMQCDMVWKGLGDYVWCSQGGNVTGYPESDVDMKRTIELQTRVSELVNLSQVLFEEGDWNGAIRAATAALDLDPENEVAYNNRGYAMERAGDLPQALENYELSCRMGNELACNNMKRLDPFRK